MDILTQEFVFTAFEAEKNGVAFPIDFDDVWETFGYTKKANARRYITTRSGLKRFTGKGLLQLELSYIIEETDKIKLSTDSYKFALARASTEQGENYLIQLIQIEKQYRQYLENLFNAVPSDRDILIQTLNDAENEILRLEALLEKEQINRTDFGYSARFVHKVSRIVNYSQVKKAIKRDFLEGRDWMEVDGEIFNNESTFFILVLSFRSLEGTDISFLPEIIRVETKLYFQYQVQRRINSRVGRTNQEVEGQQAIPYPQY